MDSPWPQLIFAAVVFAGLAFVLEGSWPSERDARLRAASAEIAAAEQERNTAEGHVVLAESLMTPAQRIEFDRLRAAPPVVELVQELPDPTDERPTS